jgi:hypothetical protein
MACSLVDVVELDDGVDLWCDDEALLRREPQLNRAWLVRGCNRVYSQPLFGAVVAMGRTEAGEARSLRLDEAELALDRVVGSSLPLAINGERRPDRAALARWLGEGIDWRN